MSNNVVGSNETALPSANPKKLILLLLSVVGGVLLAAMFLPNWLPGLASSIVGESPKAYWFLSRGSAVSAFGLLWLSMTSGLILTNRMARLWPGGPAASDFHEYTSILGMGFALFHALILMGDTYINYNIEQILIPFNSQGYKPFWVGIGQLAFYLWAIVTLSFYLRKKLGKSTWRLVHYASYATFLLALTHGILSGTDSGARWAAWMYWVSGVSLLFLLIYRIMISLQQTRPTQEAAGR